MIEIRELITNIPNGKKIGYLGDVFLKGYRDYFLEYIGEEIDIDEIIVGNITLILERKNDFIKHLRLFSEAELRSICQDQGILDISKASDSKIRDVLIQYYDIILDEEEKIELELSIESNCQFKLHDFQDRIRRKIINQLFAGTRKFLVHMPTGAGKTRTASEIVIDFIRLSSANTLLNDRMKIIWVAQQEELCVQAYETINYLFDQKCTQDLMFGHYYGGRSLPKGIEHNSAMIFCSIQQLMLNYKDSIWDKIRNDNYLVIVDEAHRSIASEWVKALDSFTANDSVILLGLTATPGSGSKKNLEKNYRLSKYYGNNKIALLDEKYGDIEKPIEYLTELEFLAKIDRQLIKSEAVILDGAQTTKAGLIKFGENTIKLLASNPDRNATIINIIEKHYNASEQILVFTCGTDHNLILSELLKIKGIENKIIEAGTKGRTSIIEDFKAGKIKVLLNFGVLTTGFDAPKTNVCIIARPIESIVMYSQMVGRILRGPKNGKGNKENTLYTIQDNLNHGDYDDLFKTFDDFWN